MSEPMSDEQLAEIRRRNDYLRNIPFDTHGPGIHGDNCPPCGMVRGIGDVTALLAELEQQRGQTPNAGFLWAVWWVDDDGKPYMRQQLCDEAEARETHRKNHAHGRGDARLMQIPVGDWREVEQ
jgi:hypothetical protein